MFVDSVESLWHLPTHQILLIDIQMYFVLMN